MKNRAQKSNKAKERPGKDQSKKHAKNGAGTTQADEKKKKWVNWHVRALYGFLMVGMFLVILGLGPLATILLVLSLQTLVFKELISISTKSNIQRHLPWARALNIYFLIVTVNSLYGPIFYKYILKVPIKGVTEIFEFCIHHHRFVSFSSYIVGFVWFVTTLRRGYYRVQITQFSWMLMILVAVVEQSYFQVANILDGLFWFIMPASFVIVNDSAAYVFGLFFGRHKLIELSPKKTWEGFLGGALTTVLFAFFFTPLISSIPFVVCPATRLTATIFNYNTCTPPPVFQVQSYSIPELLLPLLSIIGYTGKTFSLRPAQLHSMVLASFASLIAPFGGFFASAVKRAFQVKDFGDIIPGHGGVTDRFDCQFIMGAFANVYFNTFVKIKSVSSTKLLSTIITRLTVDEQLQLYENLGEYLGNISAPS